MEQLLVREISAALISRETLSAQAPHITTT
jgi:hypothetical protein